MRQKIKKLWFYGSWLFKFSLTMVFYLIVSLPLRFNKEYKDLWLIGERPDEARDNGYWLYKWVLENKPRTNIRFVLAKNSADYNKMPRKDLIIEPGSAKHYISYILSSYSVSTHMHGVCPGKSFVIPFLPFVRNKKTVFLQHGITKDAVKFRGGLDAIVACSDSEKELITKSNPRYKNKVYTVGFCRYDQLTNLSNDETHKTILVMPTFRRWLRDVGRLSDANEAFRNTAYFKEWNKLLTNKNLLEILEKNDMKLIFFPHMEMQKLAHNFVSQDERIIIGKPGEYDVQDLLKRSSILITDYSSVFFDFIYMNKPVVFYQFDREDFFSKHYASSGKPYPFGDIFDNDEKVVREIEDTVERNYRLKDRYRTDANRFYKYRDMSNCERNYNLIKDLK